MAERSVSMEEDFTVLLNQARAGDEAALELVWRSAYDELRVMARGIRAGYSHRGTPSPTTIIHEAFLKTFTGRVAASADLAPFPTTTTTTTTTGQSAAAWDSRAHFFGSFARAMAQFLIDWRRTANRLKRGGGVEPVALGDADAAIPSLQPLTEFDRALREITPVLVAELEKLQSDAPDLAAVVWLRYMATLSLEDTATILGIAPRTVSKRWNAGRAILRREVGKQLRDSRRESDPSSREHGRAEDGKSRSPQCSSAVSPSQSAPTSEKGGS